MSFKKRLLLGISMAAFMAVISLLLSYLNNDGVNENHLIGTVIAGIVIGFWIMPSTLRKKSKKNSD